MSLMADDTDEETTSITFLISPELKRAANVGAATRGLSLSEYLRQRIREDPKAIADPQPAVKNKS